MALVDVTRLTVIKALAEFDRVGKEVFMTDYAYPPHAEHALVAFDRGYDPLAVLGAAHGFLSESGQPLPASGLIENADRALQHLGSLGFLIEPGGAEPLRPLSDSLSIEERALVRWAAAMYPGLRPEETVPTLDRLCEVLGRLPHSHGRVPLTLAEIRRLVADQLLLRSQECSQWPRAAAQLQPMFDGAGLAIRLFRSVDGKSVPSPEEGRLEEEMAFPLGRIAFRIHRVRDRQLSLIQLDRLLDDAERERTRRRQDKWIRMLSARAWIRRFFGTRRLKPLSIEAQWSDALATVQSTETVARFGCADCGADLVEMRVRLGSWSMELHDEFPLIRLPEEVEVRGVVLCAACHRGRHRSFLSHRTESLNSIAATARGLVARGREPTAEKVATELGLPLQEVGQILEAIEAPRNW